VKTLTEAAYALADATEAFQRALHEWSTCGSTAFVVSAEASMKQAHADLLKAVEVSRKKGSKSRRKEKLRILGHILQVNDRGNVALLGTHPKDPNYSSPENQAVRELADTGDIVWIPNRAGWSLPEYAASWNTEPKKDVSPKSPAITPVNQNYSPARALRALHSTIVGDYRDWADKPRDARIHQIVVGWGERLPDVAKKHGWDKDTVSRLVKYNDTLKAILDA
jgi:hypothetical protein